MAMEFSQAQKTSQIQSQRMSQAQVQVLNMLSMNSGDLRDEIFSQIEKNPALEIEADGFESGVGGVRLRSKSMSDYTRQAFVGHGGQEKADSFQEVLESRADERKSLYAFLLEQISLLNLSEEKKSLCVRIAGNLDARGYHILAPLSLLNNTRGETRGGARGEDEALLAECISIVQNLEPAGICVNNMEESLLLQARLNGNAPAAALFILDGHFDFLNPPDEEKILQKIKNFLKEQKKLSFNNKDFSAVEKFGVQDVAAAVRFIRTLEPFPARNFAQDETHYISPDVYVEEEASPAEEFSIKKREIPLDGGSHFKVRISDKVIPRLKISEEFSAAQNDSPFAKKAVQAARVFLESLEYRESTIAQAACVIVSRQIEFFKKGPGNLLPLTQQDVADEIGVHETTISRMASSKYIQCRWGLFPVKYFFTGSVSGVSKESVMLAVKKIMEESAAENPGRKISDQKIADILASRGIKIARRTVAKYRSQIT